MQSHLETLTIVLLSTLAAKLYSSPCGFIYMFVLYTAYIDHNRVGISILVYQLPPSSDEKAGTRMYVYMGGVQPLDMLTSRCAKTRAPISFTLLINNPPTPASDVDTSCRDKQANWDTNLTTNVAKNYPQNDKYLRVLAIVFQCLHLRWVGSSHRIK